MSFDTYIAMVTYAEHITGPHQYLYEILALNWLEVTYFH